jgi:DNA-binding NarL/FixJ family response regulator
LTELTAIAVTLSPLASDLLAALLSARTPISVAARFDGRDVAATWLAAHAVDLILLGTAPSEGEDAAARFLALAPTATVVALAPDGRTASVRVAGADRLVIDDVSAERLAAAIEILAGQAPGARNDLNR